MTPSKRSYRLSELAEHFNLERSGGADPVIEGVGTLEAFNTDGLRTLLRTVDVTNMKEKTLRYPGHAELMRAFRDSGFFDEDPREVAGAQVRPRDLTSALLFERWRLLEGEADLTAHVDFF